ncbi:hypothetical protein ABFS83_14G285700 [Erythranthe nasuta]
MEKEGKRKKLRREKDESSEKRSPLQNLNGFSYLKNNSKKKSNLSSSSSSAAAASGKLLAPKNCLSFLLSSNSSSSSSSSTTHLDKKLKTFPKSANNEPKKKLRSRSKENEIPKKPFSQKPRSNPPQTLTHSKNSENKANPIYKNAQRSKLSSLQNNRVTKLKKGSEQFRAKTKNSQENGSIELLGVANSISLNCTPVGKLGSGPGLRSVIEDSKDERANNNSAATVKTPPVEASLSPEIQNQSHSKILVLNSAATPVCYGAGHLISGVTDKRKCRRRGSLKGGSEKVNLFEDEKDLTDDLLRDPSIPLLAEASVRWLLSPCNEGSDCKNKADECRMACDIDSGASLDVIISSPSGLCGNASDFVCSESRYSGSGSIGNLVDEGRNWNKNKDGLLSANSTRSTVSLSSRNIVETPNSDFIADVCNGKRSRLEKHQTDDFVLSELDSIRETLDMVKLSPRSEVSMWGPPSYNGINRHQENMDSVSSWVSNDATLLDNLALSRIKISWRDDELASGIVETNTDELDFCRCLSDEDEKTYLGGGIENKENGPRVDNDLSPMILDYEPRISARGKEESVMEKRSVYAESISTDGGGLVASDDSNWTYCCHESQVN